MKAKKEKFLARSIEIKTEEEKFHRQYVAGEVFSHCLTCYERIISSSDDEADIAESTHECAGLPDFG